MGAFRRGHEAKGDGELASAPLEPGAAAGFLHPVFLNLGPSGSAGAGELRGRQYLYGRAGPFPPRRRRGRPHPERTVDVQINRLRRKIEADPANPLYLQTVRGIGYRLAITG